MSRADETIPAAWSDVLAERRRQVEEKGWTAEHDDEYVGGGLALAAAAYAVHRDVALHPRTITSLRRQLWPFDQRAWAPRDAREALIRSAALTLAEIERLDRAAAKEAHDVVISELNKELQQAQKLVRFECDNCHRAVKVGEATVVQHLEFRCPGQTGGYFVDSHRWFKCPHCNGRTNPYHQPEVDAIPNALFAKIEKVED